MNYDVFKELSMNKIQYCVVMGCVLIISTALYGATPTSSENSYSATLMMLNNSINRDFVALPIIQLNINENISPSQVQYQGLSNFKIMNHIVYNTSTETMDGTIVNEYFDIMTLCPKKPGNYSIKAIIKNDNGIVSSNTMTLNISQNVYNKLNSLVTQENESKKSKNQIQAVRISSGESIAYAPMTY